MMLILIKKNNHNNNEDSGNMKIKNIKKSDNGIGNNLGFFLAHLVEHCTCFAEFTGSTPVQAWIFHRLDFYYC